MAWIQSWRDKPPFAIQLQARWPWRRNPAGGAWAGQPPSPGAPIVVAGSCGTLRSTEIVRGGKASSVVCRDRWMTRGSPPVPREPLERRATALGRRALIRLPTLAPPLQAPARSRLRSPETPPATVDRQLRGDQLRGGPVRTHVSTCGSGGACSTWMSSSSAGSLPTAPERWPCLPSRQRQP